MKIKSNLGLQTKREPSWLFVVSYVMDLVEVF